MIDEWAVLWLSLKTATVATICTLPVGIVLGWILARKRFFGKNIVDAAIHLPLVLPPVVTGYFLLYIFGPTGFIGSAFQQMGIRIAFSWWAAVLAAATVSLPLLTRSVRIAIEAIDQRYEETARTLGANEFTIFRSITLPLAINGVIAGAVLSFARSLGEFGATIVFAGNIAGQSQTIPLAIFQSINQPDGMGKTHLLIAVAIVFSFASMLISERLQKRSVHANR